MKYKYYPAYCSGYGYLTSTKVILKECNYLLTHNVHHYFVDDFFITGKLAAEVELDVSMIQKHFQKFLIYINMTYLLMII